MEIIKTYEKLDNIEIAKIIDYKFKSVNLLTLAFKENNNVFVKDYIDVDEFGRLFFMYQEEYNKLVYFSNIALDIATSKILAKYHCYFFDPTVENKDINPGSDLLEVDLFSNVNLGDNVSTILQNKNYLTDRDVLAQCILDAGLHKFLLLESPELLGKNRFSLYEKLFKNILGAVALDSNFNSEIIEHVYIKLNPNYDKYFKHTSQIFESKVKHFFTEFEIDKFESKNCLRMFKEKQEQNKDFKYAFEKEDEIKLDDKIKWGVTLVVLDQKFIGSGLSKKEAEIDSIMKFVNYYKKEILRI